MEEGGLAVGLRGSGVLTVCQLVRPDVRTSHLATPCSFPALTVSRLQSSDIILTDRYGGISKTDKHTANDPQAPRQNEHTMRNQCTKQKTTQENPLNGALSEVLNYASQNE